MPSALGWRVTGSPRLAWLRRRFSRWVGVTKEPRSTGRNPLGRSEDHRGGSPAGKLHHGRGEDDAGHGYREDGKQHAPAWWPATSPARGRPRAGTQEPGSAADASRPASLRCSWGVVHNDQRNPRPCPTFSPALPDVVANPLAYRGSWHLACESRRRRRCSLFCGLRHYQVVPSADRWSISHSSCPGHSRHSVPSSTSLGYGSSGR